MSGTPAKRRIALHPFLFAAYGVLALLAANIDQLEVQDGLRSLLLALLAATLIYLVLALVIRRSDRAALLTSALLVAFFSYGHLYLFLEGAGVGLGRHRYLGPAFMLLLALLSWWALRTRAHLAGLTRGLDWLGALLLVYPLLRIGLFQVRLAQEGLLFTARVEGAPASGAAHDLPDIYYIIPDEYPRADTLSGQYDYDNSAFLQSLRDMGFYVAEDSRSNYGQTELSLSSSLNMDYLERLMEDFDPAGTDKTELRVLIRDSAVRRKLESLGYRVVAFETGFAWTQWKDADVYITRNQALGRMAAFGEANSFEQMLLETSGMLVLNDAASVVPRWLRQQASDSRNRNHYDLVMFVLGQLERTPEIEGPKLVFVHLVIPHPPFVVRTDGSFVGDSGGFGLSHESEAETKGSFLDQVVFLNGWLEEFLPTLLDDPDGPPIILLQSDTGPGLSPSLRMNNLSAYYFPGEDYSALYPSISPVNSFRVVFNQFFSDELPLLDDASYFSTYKEPFEFKKNP
jgi:hypothetical protein